MRRKRNRAPANQSRDSITTTSGTAESDSVFQNEAANRDAGLRGPLHTPRLPNQHFGIDIEQWVNQQQEADPDHQGETMLQLPVEQLLGDSFDPADTADDTIDGYFPQQNLNRSDLFPVRLSPSIALYQLKILCLATQRQERNSFGRTALTTGVNAIRL